MQNMLRINDRSGVPHSLGRATGIAFGAAIGYLGFSRAAHAAQEFALGSAHPAIDLTIGAAGAILGAQMGDALSQQNPQKSFGLFCGLLAAQFAPALLHNGPSAPDVYASATHAPRHLMHAVVPAL